MTNSASLREVISKMKCSKSPQQTFIITLEDFASKIEGENPPEFYSLSIFSIPKEFEEELAEALSTAGYSLFASGMIVKNKT